MDFIDRILFFHVAFAANFIICISFQNLAGPFLTNAGSVVIDLKENCTDFAVNDHAVHTFSGVVINFKLMDYLKKENIYKTSIQRLGCFQDLVISVRAEITDFGEL